MEPKKKVMDQDVENKMLEYMAKITVLSLFSDSNLGLLEGKKTA